MNTLIFWIFLYIFISIGIGLFASRRVKSDTDYILAGRWLPLYVVIATTFATWFGSETVLGTSSTFQNEWLLGILSDPLGAWLCLILVGLFFAKPLYNAGITTLWDFYKQKYGRTIEIIASVMITISYIGWVSAQIVALGLIFDILTAGSILDGISQMQWSFIGGLIVLIYTFFGGMWSVAMTDFLQMIIIVLGLIFATTFIVELPGVGGYSGVFSHALEAGKFDLFPEGVSFTAIIGIVAAILTMGFGSIPQQDVFQRVLSANSAKNAQRWGIIGGSLYILIAIFPIMLGYAAMIAMPELSQSNSDTQTFLPMLILQKTPIFIQIMFFGALISAIMSTASGTLLAPSALITENIIRPFFSKISDKNALRLTKTVVFFFFSIMMIFVTYKYFHKEANIFEMVENAYKITLAGAFVPLVMALIFKKVSSISALIAMFIGVGSWIFCEFILGYELIFAMLPHFFGFLMSVLGFLVGHVLFTKILKK